MLPSSTFSIALTAFLLATTSHAMGCEPAGVEYETEPSPSATVGVYAWVQQCVLVDADPPSVSVRPCTAT